ncbi:MAG: hypothetical protein ACUVXA_09935 [Candidatus Jordarchaeum sp.]|uniref:hypothetical protein n=1 Tax=Candidatus Jordarchaeum sp. TaxID=2823881 RepID=UPI00404A19BA
MEDLRIVGSGMPFLDSLLGGGFLSNSIIVISHQAAINFWELVYRILLNDFDERFYLVMVTFHLSLEEYLDRAKYSMFGSDISREIMEMLTTSGYNIIDCFNISPGVEDSKIDNTYYVSNPFNTDNLLSVMSKVRESVPGGKWVRWCFYNLTNMSIGVPEDELVKFCRRAFRYHKSHGDLAVYLLNEKAHTDIFYAKVYQLSDVFIKLVSEETPKGIRNGIQVIKSVFPFQSKKTFYNVGEKGQIQFSTDDQEIEPQISNSSYFRARFLESVKKSGEDSKLFRTGISKLDNLLGGGIFSNSVVITSFQYGVRTLDPLHHIFQNKFDEKTHVIQVNYRFSAQEYETRSKVLEQRTEIHKAPVKSFSHGNMSVIDCFNIPQNENNMRKGNVYPVSNPFDVDKLLSVMTSVRNAVPEDKSVFWIFYSLTDMSIGISEDELLKFCRRAFSYHKWHGDLALYTLKEQAHSEIFHAKLYQLSDVLIKFIAENMEEGLDTSIQILKSPLYYNPTKTKYRLNEKGHIQFLDD